MASHHPGKFSGHKHCDSEDIILLLVEEQESICSLKSVITIYLLNTWYIMLLHKKEGTHS